MIIQYGLYLQNKLLVPYDSPKKAYMAAIIAYEETGVFHEVRIVKEASKNTNDN